MLTVVFVASATLAAQAPDLTGTWKLDLSQNSSVGGGTGRGGRGGGRAGRQGGGGGGLGLGPSPEELTIRQDATTLTIEQRGTPVTKVVYRLDGQETKGVMPVSTQSTREATFRSEWKDGKLVTSMTTRATSAGTQTVTFQEVRYLDANGSLRVETSIRGKPGSRSVVYKKVRRPGL
jgi:hypothetical protein